jgi:hypothetical protein
MKSKKMSVYNKINEAVKKTDIFVKEGTSLQNAVKKATEGLNLETTKRVVEQYNVNKFLDLLKSGDDRTTVFELANPYLVAAEKQDAELEKESYVVSDDFYLNKKKEKTAFLKTLNKKNEPLYKEKQKNIFGKYWEQSDFLDRIKKEHYILKKAALERAKVDFTKGLMKIAKYATKKDYAEIYCAVKNDKFGKLILAKLLPKNAMLEKKSYIEDKNGIVDDFLGYVENYKKMIKIAKKDADEEKNKNNGKKKGLLGKTMNMAGNLGKKTISTASMFGKKTTDAIKSSPLILGNIIDVKSLIGADNAQVVKDEFDRVEDKSNKFINALKHKEVYEDLANFDKEISRISPELTSTLYHSLLKVAPTAMTNKEIARSYLKSLGTMADPTLSVYDAEQLRKLEDRLNGKRGYRDEQ